MKNRNFHKTLLALAVTQLLSFNVYSATDPDGDPAKTSEWLNDINPDYPVAAVIKVNNKYIDDVIAKIKGLSTKLTDQQLKNLKLGSGCPVSAEPHRPIDAEPHKPIDAEPHKPISAEPHKEIEAEPHQKYCSPIAVNAYLNPKYENLIDTIEVKEINEKYEFIALSAYRTDLELLQTLNGVSLIEHDPKRYAFHHGSDRNYHRTLVQADKNYIPHNSTTPDEFTSNMKICIIDTGLDMTHLAFTGMNITGTDMTIPSLATTNWNVDEEGHGTHVTGIIAAQTHPSLKYEFGSIPVGDAPNGHINIHMVKVTFGTRGTNIGRAIQECVDQNANIISMSLGGDYPSHAEQARIAANANILLTAAAGNDGSRTISQDSLVPDLDRQTALSYPASYPEVISVAAIDQYSNYAPYSQRNAQVELAAPGTHVVSTVPVHPANSYYSEFIMGGMSYKHPGGHKYGVAVVTNTNGDSILPSWYQENTTYNISNFVDCGDGSSVCPASNQPGPWGCLIERGTITFREKALNCEAGGGSHALIYNNIVPDRDKPEEWIGANLGDQIGAPTIPVFTSEIDFKDSLLLAQAQANNFYINRDPNHFFKTETRYDYRPNTGTSMATPVVSAVAALLWSHNTSCSAIGIREALTESAKDLGTAGRDHKYGFGLVQYLDAENWIANYGCQQ